MENNQETLLEFPVRFPIKVMGKNTQEFRDFVARIAREKIVPADFIEISARPSKNGQFLALNILATFHDKSSIDAVYQALTGNPLVLMAL